MKEMISQYTTPKVMIMERSILTDKCIFAEMLHDSGEMTDMEWFLYNEFYSLFYPMYPISGILYVSTNPEISKERIKQRDRKGEETISAEYLEALDKQHQKWITHTSLPVLTISTEKELSKNIEAIKEFIINLHYSDDWESETYPNKA
jgi:deoxyadenosine/deoxycytidine kinase